MAVSIAGKVAVTKMKRASMAYHLVFWLSLALVTALLSGTGQPFLIRFGLEFAVISFYAIIVYFNIYYLFPIYLRQKKLSMHLLWLMAASAVLTPLRTLILVFIAPTEILKYSFIENQYFVFLSTFFVAASSSIYSILTDWMSGQNEKQELANQTLQSELKFLKSQINPHFLFNTLNSLYALTLKKSDLAPEIVLKLSEMMRYMLYECNEKSVPLDKEVNYIANYLDLEKLRHGKKINIHFNQSGEIRNQQIAPLLFIPFIENCFKHGVSNQIAEAFVNINLDITKDEVKVVIENSKHAVMPGVHMKKSGGIGLVNVRRRLELLYPNGYTLDISDTPTTYKVTLSLKLNLN
ncbi:MAG: histidine kinase [Saprospiraceae bacterium]|nr:histidine kinase [Saprospiraceae bacterium]